MSKKNYIQQHTFTFNSNKYLSFSKCNESAIINVYVQKGFWDRYKVYIRSVQVQKKKAFYVCSGFNRSAYEAAQTCFKDFLNY